MNYDSQILPSMTYDAERHDWASVQTILDQGIGYVRLTGFPISEDEAHTSRAFETLAQRFGIVTPHGASNQTIWRVSPRVSLDHVSTFSEVASEAPLHTDTSWTPTPERYFALLAIEPAADGGDSLVFPIRDLLAHFAKTPQGPAALRTLKEKLFPFAMPVVFRADVAREIPVTLARVIESDNFFRFRYDVIQTGFAVRPELATADRVAAVEAFHHFLTKKVTQTAGVRLQRGDCLLANNRTVLHARSNFCDPRRLLLRARIAGKT